MCKTNSITTYLTSLINVQTNANSPIKEKDVLVEAREWKSMDRKKNIEPKFPPTVTTEEMKGTWIEIDCFIVCFTSNI